MSASWEERNTPTSMTVSFACPNCGSRGLSVRWRPRQTEHGIEMQIGDAICPRCEPDR